MRRKQELSGGRWERILPLMPQVTGRSRPFRDHRQVVEGIVFRYRYGVASREVPEWFGPSRGGLSTKIHHAVDGKGPPSAVLVGPGQGGDAPSCADAASWPSSPSRAISKATASAAGPAVDDRTHDPVLYKARNVVERAFCLLKQWRGPTPRSDKHAITHRGAVILAAIITWLRAQGAVQSLACPYRLRRRTTR